MATVPTLKLVCFDLGPRGEATRVTLFLAGIPFEDERLTHAQWPQMRERFPYRKVPVLYVNGEEIAESQGILRYVGRLAGMYPANDAFAAMLVDELLASYEELFQNYFVATMLPDREEGRRLRDKLIAGPLPAFLRQIDTRLANIAAQPLFQSEPKAIYVHEVLTWDYVCRFKRGFFGDNLLNATNDLPAMTAAYEKVAADPRVQLWVKSARESIPKQVTLTSSDEFSPEVEAIRLAFSIGGVHYKHETLTHDEFSSRKHEFPYEQLPVLTVDGQVAARSFTLLRYAGTLAGLYPTNDPLLALRIDEVCGHTEELYVAIAAATKYKDPQQRRLAWATLATDTIPKALGPLDQRVSKWSSGNGSFAVGSSLTIADLVIYTLLLFLKRESPEPPPAIDALHSLLRIHDHVATLIQ